jgi:diguanylate cyclase (GGDEF)-like protein
MIEYNQWRGEGFTPPPVGGKVDNRQMSVHLVHFGTMPERSLLHLSVYPPGGLSCFTAYRSAERSIIAPVRLGLAALLLALLTVPAVALDPAKAVTQYSRRVWQIADGLPQNSVNAIVQDRQGYLWLSTQEGLARFDGVSFTVYDKLNTPAITNNNVRALLVDRTGALWVGTNGGGLVRMQDGRFQALTTRDGLAYDIVTALAEGADGAIWIATYGGGLSCLREGRFINYTTTDGLAHNSILSLHADADGTIWIGTNGAGVCRFRGGDFVRFDERQGLPNPVVYSLARGRDGTLWAGTYGGGLARWDGQRFRTVTTRNGLSSDRVLSVFEDRNGNLWIGTFGGGVCRRAEGRWSTFSRSEGLPYEVSRSFCEDREGNLWIGTDGGGLVRLADGSFTTTSVQEGLSNAYAIGILETRSGDIWIGTNGGGLNLLRNGRIIPLDTRHGFPHDLIRTMWEATDGALWVGTDGGGLVRLQDGRMTRYTTREGLSADRVISVRGDRRGVIWAGTNGAGLNRIENGRITTFSRRAGRLADLVNLIHEDRSGRLWIGTYGGLWQFRDGQFVSFPGQAEIGSAIVTHIHEDDRGVFWLGTIGSGLIRLDGDRVTRITRQDGLYDDVAYEILEDGLGYLWMSGNRGVYKVPKAEVEDFAAGRTNKVHSTAYGSADGMKCAECNGGFQPSGIRTRDGRLWFPTSDGVAVVDPRRIRVNREPPPVLVERILVNGKTVEPRSPLLLPPGRNDLEIHYTALSLVAPEKVRFRYTLEGFDQGWLNPGTRRIAYYTNVPPGEFTFRVIACNNDGIWNRTGTWLTVVQKPHLWQSPWFPLLVGGLLVLIVAGAGRVRESRLKSRQRELELLVDERTIQLRVANERLEKLSTEDALTGLANRRRFDEHLDALWRQYARARTSLAVVVVDLDGFKQYNDFYGHPQGDVCLVQVAGVLAGAAQRAGDLVARYGGEEFVLVLAGANVIGASRLAETLRARVEELAVPHQRAPHGRRVVTISLGVAAAMPDPDASWRNLVARADTALYLAKQNGRNRVEIAEERPERSGE